MIDLLIRWPDSPTAIACGQILGCTAASESDPEVMQTASKFGVINLAVIGQHSYISDNSDPENPIMTTAAGHWVLVRVPAGFDIAEALSPIPESLQPEIVWSSDMTDDEDNPIPRPPISEAPQLRWC